MAYVERKDVEVVDHRGSMAPSAMVAIVAGLLILGLIAFAVLWTRPWDDNGPNNNVPSIGDNSGNSQPANSGSNTGGSTDGGSTDGGSNSTQP